jgi:hypothetical protein
MGWDRGEVITVKHVFGGEVRFAQAAIVVEDRPDGGVALWTPLGSAMQWNSIDFATGAFAGYRPMRRHTTDALMLIEPGASHATTLMWSPGQGRFLCWYVDLQDPGRREGRSLVTWDQSLDIVVGPDRRWRWKDEDHFQWVQDLGWLAPDRAQELRSEGLMVIARIEAAEPPFDGLWLDWRPDAAWSTPELAEDWAQVPGQAS